MKPFVEYQELINLVEDPTASKDEVYTKLMAKEQNVLDVVDRIVNDKNEMASKKQLFYNLTMVEFVVLLTNTWKNWFKELFIEQQYRNIKEVFFNNDRKIYLGVTIVLIALFLFFVDVSK